jgi:hypothetical protein
LAQRSVDAKYSGAIISSTTGDLTIEGTKGFGDTFMVGTGKLAKLPSQVLTAVSGLYNQAFVRLGPVRMEWVYDGSVAWVVQFHRGTTPSSGSIIYPGEASSFKRFDVRSGLESLRSLIDSRSDENEGILLVGDVGVTSHFGDLLRKARIPSRIERSE